MSKNEFQLWDSYNQVMINDYRRQSDVLTAFFDCCRFGCRSDHLDLIYQRPNDKPIFLGSGRDATLLEWLESIDALIINLRLRAGTDLMGLFEFLEYGGYQWVAEDRGGTNTVLNMERYAAVVSDDRGIGEGVGATELEAVAQAVVQLREQHEDSYYAVPISKPNYQCAAALRQ